MNPRSLALAAALVSALALACGASSESESQASSGEALAAVPGGPGVDPTGKTDPGQRLPPPPVFPPKRPVYCPAVDPACSMSPFDDPAGNAALAAKGCAPAQHWLDGYSAGWLGGIITLCRDTPAVRAEFNPFQIKAMDGACDACIPKAPPGTFWVELEAFVGPNCQSGCTQRPPGW